MYALMDPEWKVYGLYRDMRIALTEMRTADVVLTLINNVTGEVICHNADWDYYRD